MRQLLACLALMVSCSADPEAGDNHAADGSVAVSKDTGRDSTGRFAELIGRYESGAPKSPNQLCIIGNEFGIVVWGPALHSCSGSGRIDRDGDRLRLTMTGDSSCVLDARITGTSISLPDEAPPGCAYYCGARARLQDIQLKRVGASRADALKAKDLVGEALCAD